MINKETRFMHYSKKKRNTIYNFIYRAALAWNSVSDSGVGITTAVQSENGRKRRLGPVDRVNFGYFSQRS